MITKQQKEQIVADYGRTAGDTGSPEVQIAILTARINIQEGVFLRWSDREEVFWHI